MIDVIRTRNGVLAEAVMREHVVSTARDLIAGMTAMRGSLAPESG